MTNNQPEVLRLAQALESQTTLIDYDRQKAAAELRRLHKVNAELIEALDELITWYAARDSEDDLLPNINQNPEIYQAMQTLAKAQGDNNG